MARIPPTTGRIFLERLVVYSCGCSTEVGDFELNETKRAYAEIALGYKLGPITPFVGYSTFHPAISAMGLVVGVGVSY